MKAMPFAGLVLCLGSLIFAHHQSLVVQNTGSTPGPAFILSNDSSKPNGSVIPYNDRRAITENSIAGRGLLPVIQIASLSFSASGKILAAGNTLDRVELWDVENRTKLRSLKAGSIATLTPNGNLLAANGIHGKDIELWDVSTGTLKGTIPRRRTNSKNFVDELTFNQAATLLDVTVNDEDDSVYAVTTRKLVAVLKDTKHGRFSNDGSFLIGASPNHLIVWKTSDWSVVRDLPIGPEVVVRIAASPENDLVLIGGGKSSRLLRLSSGIQIANLGSGYTTFAALDGTGSFAFTDQTYALGVWNTSGNGSCAFFGTGNGIAALSPDNRWLAVAMPQGDTSIAIWDVRNTISSCGASLNDPAVKSASATNSSLIAQGKSRYAEYKCGECHGLNGEGGPDGPDLTTTYMDAGMISRFLDKPSPDAYMKGMPNIPATHPDNQSLVAYVVSLKRAPTLK